MSVKGWELLYVYLGSVKVWEAADPPNQKGKCRSLGDQRPLVEIMSLCYALALLLPRCDAVLLQARPSCQLG